MRAGSAGYPGTRGGRPASGMRVSVFTANAAQSLRGWGLELTQPPRPEAGLGTGRLESVGARGPDPGRADPSPAFLPGPESGTPQLSNSPESLEKQKQIGWGGGGEGVLGGGTRAPPETV